MTSTSLVAASSTRPTILSLPDDLIRVTANWLAVGEQTNLKFVCKAFRSAISNKIVSELETTSRNLESEIKLFRQDCGKLLEKTQTTWTGWLVHKLSFHDGFLGKIASIVQSLFLRFSFSFRCEFAKQAMIRQQMMRDLKTEAQKETLFFPGGFSVDGQLISLSEDTKSQRDRLFTIDGLVLSLVKLKARKKAFDSFVEAIGGKKDFYSKPVWHIPPRYTLAQFRRAFGRQMRLIDLIASLSTHSVMGHAIVSDPIMRGSFDGTQFVVVKLRKTGQNETQLRFYEEQICGRGGSVAEWHVYSRNSEVGKRFPLASSETLFSIAIESNCVISSDDLHQRILMSLDSSLAELRQLVKTGKCDGGWELA